MTDRHSPHAERKFTAKEIIAAWLGAFFGIAALAWVVTNMPEAKLLVIGGTEIHSMGIGFIWIVFIDVIILLVIALFINNAFSRGSYPTRWS